MALYHVQRTGDVQPGEFVSAYVIAGGAAQARKAVAHMEGVTARNVTAERQDTTGGIDVLSAYFDERDTDDYPVSDGQDMLPGFLS